MRTTISIAFLWLFLSSGLDSLSVFNVYVEQIPVTTTGLLQGAWSSSMSFICLAAMPTMIASGVVAGQPVRAQHLHSDLALKTSRVKFLILFASITYASLAFAGLAAAYGSAIGIWFFITVPGLGFGVFYVLALELLVACAPKRATLLVGLGLMIFSFGVIVLAIVFKWLIDALGVVSAVYASAAIISVPLALTALVVQWPSPSEKPVQGAQENNQAADQGLYIHPSRFPRLPLFWMFVFTFLTLQAGAALYSYFISVGMSFSKPIEAVIPYFQLGNLVGLAVRLPVALFINVMKFGTGVLGMGSKNVMLLLLVIQIILLLLMWTFSLSGDFVPFALCGAAMWAILSGSATAAPILARDLFGQRNGPTAFGIASSISFGGGEFFAMYLISLVDKFGGIGERKPPRFIPFYAVEVGASLVALLCCFALQRSYEAFPQTNIDSDERVPLKRKAIKDCFEYGLQSEA